MARQGEAAPVLAATVPHGTTDTIALTVRLHPERYRRLVA